MNDFINKILGNLEFSKNIILEILKSTITFYKR